MRPLLPQRLFCRRSAAPQGDTYCIPHFLELRFSLASLNTVVRHLLSARDHVRHFRILPSFLIHTPALKSFNFLGREEH